MKRVTRFAILVSLIAGLLAPSAALAKYDEVTVDILVLAEGSTDALVRYIRSLGGTIKYQYRNAPVVAATIPADKLGQVAGFAGVTKVEKDDMVYLTDDLEAGKNDQHPLSFIVEDMEGVEVQAVDPATVAALPEGYANPFFYTGAYDVWDITSGDGTIVAVIDSGTAPNACLEHAVIGAPGYPDGYNAAGDGIPATSSLNHWHGTVVGGVIASSCALNAGPTNLIYLAQAPYLGWPSGLIPIWGQAPGAKLYPVKVFAASNIIAPESIILDGVDHVLTLKKEGVLDIDIVNMSIGGPTLWDGHDAYAAFFAALREAGILVVTSAGNNGPTPNTVGSPATCFDGVAVGALDYAPSSRTAYEYIGLRYMGVSGQGMVMRPTAETRVANFSARGPLSDGRFGPEIAALGNYNLAVGPQNYLYWAVGTSFAAPTVAGGAALLNAWWEAQGYETDPEVLENVLFLGADAHAVGEPWQGINDQGYGALDVLASLDHLMAGDWKLAPAKEAGALIANVLGAPVPGKVETWESESITVDPGVPFNAVLGIGKATSEVTIEVWDIVTPDNSAYAYWPNALEVYVQSAKRTAVGQPVAVSWYPFDYGDAFDIVIEDGPWTLAGIPWAYQPMEPGLMKLTLIGSASNESPVSFKVRITRENLLAPLQNRIANGVIQMSDHRAIPAYIPEGTTMATFDLTWGRDWSKFPTSQLDMYIFDPEFHLVSVDGATGNAPERSIIEEPVPGWWYVYIDGEGVDKSDNYDLFLTLE